MFISVESSGSFETTATENGGAIWVYPNQSQPVPALKFAWECPRCHRMCAPHVDHCDCSPQYQYHYHVPNNTGVAPADISGGSRQCSA